MIGEHYFHITVTDKLVLEAGHYTEVRALKGYDAIQLSSALETKQTFTDQVLFSTWDRALARAATAEGLSLAHEVIS